LKKDNHLIFGIRPIIEAIESGKQIDKLFVQKGSISDTMNELTQVARKHKLTYKIVPVEKLNRLTPKNHQGAVAFTAPIDFESVYLLIPRLYEKGLSPLIVMLDGVTDVRNFGAIVRSAECAGADAVIISSIGGAAVNSDAVKASAGALFKVPVCKEYSLNACIDYLKLSGFKIIACTEKAKKEYYNCDYTEPTCIVMGAEDTGISDNILSKSDEKTFIPMSGEIGSLNVSVASGIILFEAHKQRNTK
jgi:23S rRNA (guanosine2251-2'-O)-methyltransferase